jgi:putative membrane protein
MAVQNLRDHAANERTFLAWVRTSVAIVGFGFLVERFDLFVAAFAPRAESRISVPAHEFGHMAGLTLIVLGMAMIGVAAWRFRRTAREIDAVKLHPGTGSRADIALAMLLVLLCAGLLVYLYNALSAAA